MTNAYERYSAWNKALYGYYFNNDSQQEVVLYVDDDVLTEIGQNNPLINEDLGTKTYPQHFVFSTCIKRDDRIYFPKISSDKDDYPSFYKLVLRSTKRRPREHSIECLGFTVLLIYLYQKEGRTEKRISQYLARTIGDRSFSFDIIDTLWKSIENHDDRFVSDSLADGTQQPYAGRLKYHLVLSKRYTKTFLDLLITHQLRWDEQQESFGDFINHKVWRHLSGDLLDVLGPALNDLIKRPFFESLIRHCDYSSSSSIDGIKRDLLFVYHRKWSGGAYAESLYLRSDEPSPIYFARTKDSIQPVSIEDIDSINNVLPDSYEIPIKDKGITYVTLHSQYILLKSIGNGLFEQVYEPEVGYSYLFVYRGSTSFLQNQTVQEVRLPAFYHWHSSFIQSWQEQPRQHNNRLEDKFTLGSIPMSYPHWAGGLKKNSREYYLQALPYVEFETADHITDAQIEWRIVNSANPEWTKINHPHIIENRCYLMDDISSITHQGSFLHIELRAVNNDGTVIPIPPRLFVSTESLPCPVFMPKYGYNRFGESCDSGFIGEESHFKKSSIRHPIKTREHPLRQSPLIDILLQVADTESGIISQDDLRRVLRYVLKYFGLPDNSETWSSLIGALISLGYMDSFYSDSKGYFNQLRKPSLVRTHRRFDQSERGVYLLYGCYSRDQVSQLKKNDKLLIRYYPLSDKAPLSCLPDRVLIEVKDSNILQSGVIDSIPIKEQPLAYGIISNMAGFTDSEKHYLDHALRLPSPYAKEDCPRIEMDTVRYLHWSYNGTVEKAAQYSLEGEESPRLIPASFMNLYLSNSHNDYAAILIPNGDLRNEVFNEICFTPRMIRGCPLLLDRALSEFSIGLPKKEWAFVYDAQSSRIVDLDKEPLFVHLTTYSVSADSNLYGKILERLTGDAITNWNEQKSAFISGQVPSYKMFIKIEKDFLQRRYTMILWSALDKRPCGFVSISTGSTNDDSIICATIMNKWKRFSNVSVNEVLSSIIGHKEKLSSFQSDDYPGKIPAINADYQEIKILKKINNE